MKLFLKLFIFTLLTTVSSINTWSATPEPEAPAATANTTTLNIDSARIQVSQLLDYAKTFRGVPYRHGASSPKGFDCSGFTSYVYKDFGYKLSRSARGQVANGTRVDRSQLKPGDLVFFGGRRNGKGVGHVGIVTEVDDNGHDFTFIHASCSKGITENHSSNSYYKARYRTACRVIDQDSVNEQID